jgi:membrane protein YqaA with SNARE-associated domain
MADLERWIARLQSHPWLDTWLFAALVTGSLVMFVLGVVLVPVVVARIPTDYFMRRHQSLERLQRRSRWVGVLALLLKNTLGVVLILAGVAMLVLPGQGVLTLLVGITLVDFPGKSRCELWLIRRRPVLRAVGWIRAKAGRPPLELPRE